jgi:hypothetical protein
MHQEERNISIELRDDGQHKLSKRSIEHSFEILEKNMYKLKMLKMDSMIEEITTNMEILCAKAQQRMGINSDIYQQNTELDTEMEELLACLR